MMDALSASLPAFPEFRVGEVWLVGAGPGDPRLLTLMAVHALRSADAVVHDALVDARVLDLVPAGAEVRSAGKRGGKPSPHQADINDLVIGLARAGRKVVRLKGGDPFVFGRGGEEARALARAGIRFRVVPGLTAGLAAASLAGIPATTRETNHAVILATGHRAVDDRSFGDWELIARTRQPVVLYMAMSHLADIAAAFVRAGMDPETPVTIIAAATFPGERVLQTRISAASADAREAGIGPPAIVIVGKVAALGKELREAMLGAAQ
jgi:uroporphyrin-III C-methyltransferase